MCPGWYREVAVKSEHSHRTRGLLAARAKLVGMRKEVANQLRGLLKVFGHVIGAVGGAKFDARARALAADDTTLTITAEARPRHCLPLVPPLASRSRNWTSCSLLKRVRIRLASDQ